MAAGTRNDRCTVATDLPPCRRSFTFTPLSTVALGSQYDYVRFLATQIGVPVSIVSVGPERRQTIVIDERK